MLEHRAMCGSTRLCSVPSSLHQRQFITSWQHDGCHAALRVSCDISAVAVGLRWPQSLWPSGVQRPWMQNTLLFKHAGMEVVFAMQSLRCKTLKDKLSSRGALNLSSLHSLFVLFIFTHHAGLADRLPGLWDLVKVWRSTAQYSTSSTVIYEVPKSHCVLGVVRGCGGS